MSSTGVLAQKTSLVKKMLLSAQGEEVRFVVRILVSNLRIGAVRLTLLTSLARCFCLSGKGGGEYWISEEEREIMQKIEMEELVKMENKSKSSKKGGKGRARKDKGEVELRVEEKFERAVKKVRKVWARHPNFGDLVKALLDGGLDGLEERVGLTVGELFILISKLEEEEPFQLTLHGSIRVDKVFHSNPCWVVSHVPSPRSTPAWLLALSYPKPNSMDNADKFTFGSLIHLSTNLRDLQGSVRRVVCSSVDKMWEILKSEKG